MKKPIWPFTEPHADALPQNNDTLAEAFVKILRMYLTPYNFAPIASQGEARRGSSAPRPSSARAGRSSGTVAFPMQNAAGVAEPADLRAVGVELPGELGRQDAASVPPRDRPPAPSPGWGGEDLKRHQREAAWKG